MGDFNSVNLDDRQHGTEVQESEMKDFGEFMIDTGMSELQTTGRA